MRAVTHGTIKKVTRCITVANASARSSLTPAASIIDWLTKKWKLPIDPGEGIRTPTLLTVYIIHCCSMVILDAR
jgi:hypothetical protein